MDASEIKIEARPFEYEERGTRKIGLTDTEKESRERRKLRKWHLTNKT